MATIPVVSAQDKRSGLITAIIAMCTLLLALWFLKFEIADPAPTVQSLEASYTVEKEPMEAITVQVGMASDASSLKNVSPLSDQVITQKKSAVTVPSNPSLNSNSIANPFTSDDGESKEQQASRIGKDGENNLDGNTVPHVSQREVITHVNSQDIRHNYDASFVFQIGINADGYPVDVRVIKSLTTTSDERIIRKVTELVKQQVRYSKSNTNRIQTVRYTVNFKVS